MELTFKFKNKIGIAKISGRLTAANINTLRTQFSKNIKTCENYVFDLQEMDFIDSTGLGVLVECLKHSVEQNGTIKIANLQKKPKMLFEITRVCKLFDIFDSLDGALQSFS